MMLANDPTPPPSDARSVLVAVITAALTAAATSLVTWGVDELRAKYGTAPKTPDPTGGST